ncbi:MAG: hypothetical protein LIP16_12725 [Clostridium sp.]|nr:hypothetical protein [Clostridium sp.]
MNIRLNELSDEKLLEEFQWAAGHIPDGDVPQRSSEEFDKILSRVEEERKK